jgi:hypothetical protein
MIFEQVITRGSSAVTTDNSSIIAYSIWGIVFLETPHSTVYYLQNMVKLFEGSLVYFITLILRRSVISLKSLKSLRP